MNRDRGGPGREVGIRRFVAYVLPGNRRMIGLLRDAGLPERARVESGIVRSVLDLDGAGRVAPAP